MNIVARFANRRIIFSLVVAKVFLSTTAAFSSKEMKAVRQKGPSAADLYIGEAPIPELKDKEVQLKVMATAINRADTLQRQGKYNPPPDASDVLGLEAAGVIHKVGPDCPASISVGQKVMALLTGGGNAEFVNVRFEQLIPIPESLTFSDAAAIPEAWLTAFQLLHIVGKLEKSDTVLVHAGGSGVGTAVVQLIRVFGATSIITAGSQDKIDFAISLGAKAGINYKQDKVGEAVLKLTNGKGVNLILDCVGGSMYDENFQAIAQDGRWVMYGTLGGTDYAGNVREILRKRVTITGSTLRFRSPEYKASLVQNFTNQAVPLFKNGSLRPIVYKVLPWTEIAEAHRIMEANENLGKIVLLVDEFIKQEL